MGSHKRKHKIHMVNKVILIGNVGQDPEIRYTGDVNNSAKVATLRLATTERFRGRDGNLQEHTEWHSIVVWRNTADVVEKYVKKGTQLYIEGRLRSRSWDDQNGNKRYVTEIVADTLQLLGKRSDNPNAPQSGYQTPGQQSYQKPAYQQPQQPYQQPGYPQQPLQQPAQPQTSPVIDEQPDDDLPF